jgi:hypothetical protein
VSRVRQESAPELSGYTGPSQRETVPFTLRQLLAYLLRLGERLAPSSTGNVEDDRETVAQSSDKERQRERGSRVRRAFKEKPER